jgi:hypothetical protein
MIFTLAFKNKQRILATVAVSVFLTSVILIAAISYFPSNRPAQTTSSNSVLTSGAAVDSTSVTASNLATTIGFGISPEHCNGNCTINVPWTSVYHMYRNFTNLGGDSDFVLLANVSSESTVPINGIPVTSYNIKTITELLGNAQISQGQVVQIAQVGGTANGITMNINGSSLLRVGGTYVFFLYGTGGKISIVNQGVINTTVSQSTTVINGTTITYQSSTTVSYSITPHDPLAQYVAPVDNGSAFISVGGPQGVFIVQGGIVYSLDHLYPQDDAWLPLKVPGVPLAQFIQEVQSAQATTTSVSTSSSTIKG